MEPLFDPKALPKPRKGFVAFLFSLLTPGLGQIYNGQLKKAGILLALMFLLPLLFGITRWATHFYGFVALLILETALRIFIVVDAVRTANRSKEYIPKPFNTWYNHLFIGVGILAAVGIFDMQRVVGIQSYFMPVASSSPTLLIDDRLIVDTRAYRHKAPAYGDIVVFKREDGLRCLFRVVGLPNDRVAMVDNIVSINGKVCKSAFLRQAEVYEGGFESSMVTEHEEILPNGHRHRIYKTVGEHSGEKANTAAIRVPKDCYVVLGDHRDNAFDSRYAGFVSKSDIIGQAVFTFWGSGPERVNIDLRAN